MDSRSPKTLMTTILLLFIIALISRLMDMNFVLYVLTLVALWAYLGQCWNICYGYAGILSFGHAAFFGIGAYTSTLLLLNYGMSPWVGILFAGSTAALLGLVMGIPTLKLKGAYFALATIAVSEMVRLLTLKLDFITNGALGLLLPTNLSPLDFYFYDAFHWFLVIFIMLCTLLFISYRFENSRLGIASLAIKNDEIASAALGVYPFKIRMIVLALSAFFTGIGGVFYAQFVGYIRPDIVLTPVISDQILLVPLLGGVGTLMGPVIGAIIFIILKHLFLALFGGGTAGAYLIIYGALIVIVARFMPQGIYPLLRSAVRRLSKT